MSKPFQAGFIRSSIASLALESEIAKMTRETTSGDCGWVGEASITVWYGSNIWAWEYLGETFWDLQDLAEAILHGSESAFLNAGRLPNKNKGERSRTRTTRMVSGQDLARPIGCFNLRVKQEGHEATDLGLESASSRTFLGRRSMLVETK